MPEPLLPDWTRLQQAEILKHLGGIYEHSQWVADRLLSEGLSSPSDRDPAGIAIRMRAIVDAAGPSAQLTLLRAHPELAGKLAIAGKLTADSRTEQSSAGLDQCSAEEFAAFRRLNAVYTGNFGHPFIIAVRGLSRAQILSEFESRAKSPPAAEFATALAEVHKIARLRLQALASKP